MKKNYIGELSEYMKKNLKKGYTLDSLRWALIDQGHSKLEVAKAMKKVEEDLIREAPVLKTNPDITYEVIVPEEKKEESKPFWKKWFGL
ncbi:MAG: hypothetical protein AABW82_01155 [Nanoarchaeota archaeon]|nr:hypothetical protein [Nanoarchaeota archaeon]